MLKRYLVFCGYSYYPTGGWGDFRGSYNSLEEAQESLKNVECDWEEIIDTENLPRKAGYPNDSL